MRIRMLTGRLAGQEFEVGESERFLLTSGAAELVDGLAPPVADLMADLVAESPAGRADGDDERLEDAQGES